MLHDGTREAQRKRVDGDARQMVPTGGPPRHAGGGVMLGVLRQRNFALVWVAGLISLLGDWALFVAMPLAVYDLTGSTAATAAWVAVRSVPRLVLGSVAGVFVDRWDRRRTMLVSNLLLGLCLLPLLLVRSSEWLWLLYLVSFVQSSLMPFLGPAENALLPRLVAEADLVPANALNGLNDNLARLVGPLLGGLVVAGWGLTGAALLDAASFFAAAGLIALVAVDGRATGADTTTVPGGAGAWAAMWREWAAGLGLVRQARPLAALFIFMAITGVGEGVMSALFAPFVAAILGGGGLAYGTIMAAQAVGGLAGYTAIGYVGRGIAPGRLLGLGAVGLGVIDLLTFNAYRVIPGVVPPIVLMVIVGLPAAGIGVGYATLVQTAVADAYRGRVLGSIGAMSAMSVLVGSGLAGALGERVGIVALLTTQSAAYVLAGALALVMLATGRAPEASAATTEAER